MRFSRYVCAAALALTGVGMATAQDHQQTINDYVREQIEEVGEEDGTLVDDIALRELAEGEEDTIAFDVDPDKSYWLYAACDDDCSDIDLEARDADGDWLDSDEEADDAPILYFGPGQIGDELRVTVNMAACDADVCVVGVGLYEEN